MKYSIRTDDSKLDKKWMRDGLACRQCRKKPIPLIWKSLVYVNLPRVIFSELVSEFWSERVLLVLPKIIS